jgi:carboxyl-terminal processing protease
LSVVYCCKNRRVVSLENQKGSPQEKRVSRLNTSTLLWVGAVMLISGASFVAGTRSDQISRVVGLSKISGDSSLDLSSVESLYGELKNKYDGKLDDRKLIDGAKHGLVEATGDPYTVYFNNEEAKSFQSALDGTFDGIGAELGMRNKRVTIVSTIDNGPAKNSGLLSGDQIIKVNDQDSSNWSIDKAVTNIRGKKGTTVKLTVIRDNSSKDFTITRDTITDPSVKSEVLDGDIGYLRISRFGEDTGGLAQKAAQDFKDQGVTSIVVDLRGNGGGYLTAATQVAGVWLNDKVVVTQRQNGKIVDSETQRTGSGAILAGVPTVVLMDGGSASASEILAGALHDHGAAKLVGEKTFGKGSVQTIEQLPDGGEVKITIARWYTPNGKNISKQGIEPDFSVAITPDDISSGRDPQKDKAITLLK